ncbi:allograft inflammatory factor 1-like [Gigantopelta aegis]|uniref:allograft inflammatory factor 1-like n=1 Tax=Gigantopelta aegis TaxID=1735272 RepID=UPI001B88E780|nr:allograft inflammatory factor 1-like [Gigantopelta aegis]
MPGMKIDKANPQGGKVLGEYLTRMNAELDEINKQFLEDEFFQDDEDLQEKLESYKKTFIEYDIDKSGDLNIMDIKYMMEKLGQAKTHLELKKMITEVDTTSTGAINYTDFIKMMLGPKSSVLKLILLFEEKMKSKETPKGLPPKKDLSMLP